MIKLMRNAWEKGLIFKTAGGETIRWQYLIELVNLQEKEGLRLGNKMKRTHIEFHKQKMKVKLATQLFSASVADALQYCNEKMKLKAFKDCEATVAFIRLVDSAFDILNSRNPLGQGSKKPINRENFESHRKSLRDCEEFLLNLQDAAGTPMHLGPRKTGFIGWILSSRSFMKLHEDLVLAPEAPLRYLLAYKFSQA